MFDTPINFSYQRVIPRDFFNESKLLKCMGQLALFEHLPNLDIEETGEPFRIGLHDAGYLATNLQTTVSGKLALFCIPYNSRSNYPLVCFIGNDEYEVFNEDGDLTPEFFTITNSHLT
jgi:hypothetical protein